MGPLGWQETIAIFVVALLLFGPKKLPQLGKDIAKAMAEFKRATSDLKGTWDREMSAMERETGINETARQIDRELTAATVDETYHGTSSGYDSGYHHGDGSDYSEALSASTRIGTEGHTEELGTTPSTNGATATQGAESTAGPIGFEHKSQSETGGHTPAAPTLEGHVEYVAETIPREKTVPAAPVHPDETVHSST